MTQKEFEIKLQNEVHRDLIVRTNPNCPDVAGVYLKGAYLFAIPSGQIFEKKNPSYTDKYGTPHRSWPEAIDYARHFVTLMRDDSELYSLMAKPSSEL